MPKTRANDPCPCRSGKKYKKCCRDKKSATESPANRSEKLASPEDQEKVFHLLFTLFREMLKSARCELPQNHMGHYAAGLATKIFRQICSMRLLASGSPIPYAPEDGINFDFGSIDDIARSAIQTYLIFHYIFIASESDEEREYKYFAWIMDSLLKRKELYPMHIYEGLRELELGEELPDVEKILKNDQQQVEVIRKSLEGNKFFEELMKTSDKDRKDRFKEMQKKGWFPRQWTHLQKNVPELDRLNAHQVLSQVAHSHYWHIRQLNLARSAKEQQELCRFGMSVLLTIMSRMIFEYPTVFPDAASALEKHPESTALAEAFLSAANKKHQTDQAPGEGPSPRQPPTDHVERSK